MDISNPGFDAFLNDPLLNPERYGFSSRWNKFDKILEAGTVSHDFGSNGETAMPEIIIPRRSGYDPIVRVQLMHPTSNLIYEDYWRRLSVAGSTGDRVTSFMVGMGTTVTTNTSSIRISNTRGRENALTGVWRFRYIVFDLPANQITVLPPPPPPEPEDLPIPMLNLRWGDDYLSTFRNFQFPTNITPGDVLVYIATSSHDSARDFTLSGFTLGIDLVDQFGGTSTRFRNKIGYRLADGSENGINDLLRSDGEIKLNAQCLLHFRPPSPATSISWLSGWGVANIPSSGSTLAVVAPPQTFPAQTAKGIIRVTSSYDRLSMALTVDSITGQPIKFQDASPAMDLSFGQPSSHFTSGFGAQSTHLVELDTFLDSAPVQVVTYTGTNVVQGPSGHCYWVPAGLSLGINW
ncbi:hypothetical protein [Terrihabitans soli]|uniref:hypothetical protein n=1 Tax=Terrihabitans soli TaxID=708113 RepID=UPI001CA362FC|nr:hypothetical protein [Terrihabitans soli]